MEKRPENSAIVASLLSAVFLWGANNAGTKYLVHFWPPVVVGSIRFLSAGLILFALFRWTKIFGPRHRITADLNRRLWWRGGLGLALYILAFNWALKLSPVSHIALYIGAAPVWALLWEERPEKSWRSIQRYGAAMLAFTGVLILFWPILRSGSGSLLGEFLGMAASVLWTNFGRQCHALGRELSGAEVSAHTFWRAGLIVSPIAIGELFVKPLVWRGDLLLIQLFCIIGSGVIAFALWNNALRHWKTSQVYLFNNLVPVCTMFWAHLCLNEPITQTFWIAMLFIAGGVILGQTDWQKIFGADWLPVE